jgi:hypothetical protein
MAKRHGMCSQARDLGYSLKRKLFNLGNLRMNSDGKLPLMPMSSNSRLTSLVNVDHSAGIGATCPLGVCVDMAKECRMINAQEGCGRTEREAMTHTA